MPLPTIFADIAETGGNAALRCDRVAACRKHLCDARSRQACFYSTLRGTQSSATSADDHHVKRMVDEFIGVR
jgi:hypothetical protein